MIGRVEEVEELNKMFDSNESEFVAVYGRRRVGKTYLVRETFDGRFTFQHSGKAKSGKSNQLKQFFKSLRDSGYESKVCPKDWDEAFEALEKVVAGSTVSKKVLFLDELPWMDTPRSDFISALESFWNGWASARKDILLIVCGSAASWMVKNLFRNRGGLHNRVTCRIHLVPFTLCECERFVQERGIVMSRTDIAECYMAIGGIPYYWRYLDKRFGLAQNFDRMFFAENAPLKHEFDELYSSLFSKARLYMRIVSALATKKIGMTLAELISALDTGASGKLSEALETLEQSGFIRKYRAIGNAKKNAVYQLIDEFTLFHFRFLGDNGPADPSYWSTTLSSQAHAVWRGLAFERLCLQHVTQMRAALGVAAVHVEAYAWRHIPDETYPIGAQIDLLLDRSDNVINVCEMKWSSGEYAIDEKTVRGLNTKIETFKAVTKTRKAVHLTFVTSCGLVRNAYWNQVQSEITLDDLFTK